VRSIIMDLLGDIGTNDQLIATRTENELLKAKVESLSKQVSDLNLQVAVLQAEVEIYREEARSSAATVDRSSSNRCFEGGVTKEEGSESQQQHSLVFQLPSSRNDFCCTPKQVVSDLHGNANPTCVACLADSSGKNILVTGGADSTVRFTPVDCTAEAVVTSNSASVVVGLSAPVVCMAAVENVALTSVPWDMIVAAGTMDGHVHCAVYSNRSRSIEIAEVYHSSLTVNCVLKKHDKYVSALSWSRRCCFHSANATPKPGHFLASASSDGTVHIFFVFESDSCSDAEEGKLQIQNVESLYFDNAITCLCFTNYNGSDMDNGIVLYAYVRNTPHLKVIRIPTNDDSTSCIISTLHLNASLLDDHVSFAVLDLKISFDEAYFALACDNHCHLIVDNRIASNPQPLATIVRKLYGHTADCYSRPVVAWSHEGQYLYCNTQNESKLCTYSIASGKLLEECNIDEKGPEQQLGHVRPIKDLCSLPNRNLVVTTSFDRNTILWTPRAAL
jgi:WD40 repeat protein